MRIDIAAQTDIGRRKDKNEDNYGVFREDTPGLQLFQEGAMLCVADGLGGHIGGEIASKLAVSLMKDTLTQPPPPPAADAEEDTGPLPALQQGVINANQRVYATNQDLIQEGKPMGTTLLAVVLTPRKAYIGNVGDSRCYHIRDGDIIARTEDHSWVDEQVKLGLMSKAEAERDARKNVVTRCIGTHPEVEMDSYIWHIVPGDMLLLCSDGLVNMVKDSDIAEEFRKNASPAEIAHRLVDAANENGGKDNITVVVADINPSTTTLLRRRVMTFSRKRGAKVVLILAFLIWGALCFSAGYLVHFRWGNILGW
jgi:protein phosphatase